MLAALLNVKSICQSVDNDSIAGKQQQSKNTDKHNVAQKGNIDRQLAQITTMGMHLGEHFFSKYITTCAF